VKRFAYFSLMVLLPALSVAEGKMLNPLTDVCWECMFPMTVSGVNVSPGHKDFDKHSDPLCFCAGTPPKAGVPITFWEPTVLVDVTRHAYTLIGLGGLKIGSDRITNRGTVSINGDGATRSSFYHVHFYSWPLIAWLEILTDFACISRGEMSVPYISELDPTWNDEQLSLILCADAAIFSSKAAHLACIADCASATAGKPLNKMFWCAGCQGSLYPFTGTVAHHVGGIQASSLLVHRLLAKMHRMGVMRGYKPDEFCESEYMSVIRKSLYKTQLVYPVAQTSGQCNPLGGSPVIWGAGKSYPYGGEDFAYLIWTKKQCCLDATTVVLAAP
jgi:conjugal transfer pilus assembly protein TraU